MSGDVESQVTKLIQCFAIYIKLAIMRVSAIRISVITISLITAGAYAILNVRPELVPAPAMAAFSASSNLKSFEFLGCSGDWKDDKLQPRVWRTGRKDKITFLISHPADCGYTIGSDPKARIKDSVVALSYSMSNDNGVFAACYCEYWASFELKSAPDKITKISVNGDDAHLMGGLSER